MTLPRLSVGQALSLVAAAAVVAVLVVALAVISVALDRSAIEHAEEQLRGSVRQLANVTATSLRQARSRYTAVAGDPLVLAALGPAPTARQVRAAATAIGKLRAPADSGLPVELWNASGERVAFAGDNLGVSMALRVPGELGDSFAQARPGLAGIRPVDSVQLGALYRRNGRTFLWLALPIVNNGRMQGLLLQQRRIALNPQAEETVRELSGDSAAAFYHNVDGTVWTSLGGSAPSSAVGPRSSVVFAERRAGDTPLVVAMEMPRDAVLARPRSIVRQLLLLSVVLTVVAAALAGSSGRRVAQPLEELTNAAESLARGNYSRRVPVRGAVEVARLSAAFNTMAAQIEESRPLLVGARTTAEAASQAKSEFLTAMSHELRTPLNAIGGYAELMELGLRGEVSADQLRDLGRIRTNQQHLLGLVGRILDLNRIERGNVTYERTNIAVEPLLTGIEALIHPQIRAKQLSIVHEVADTGLVVLADREKVRQILINLLTNAIRHSPAGASIRIGAERHSAGKIALSVSDVGPGIPTDKLTTIFEPFVQLERTLRSGIEGMGLGLAISRDLARGMEGDLTVRSVEGKGSTFVVLLPEGVAGHDADCGVTNEIGASLPAGAARHQEPE